MFWNCHRVCGAPILTSIISGGSPCLCLPTSCHCPPGLSFICSQWHCLSNAGNGICPHFSFALQRIKLKTQMGHVAGFTILGSCFGKQAVRVSLASTRWGEWGRVQLVPHMDVRACTQHGSACSCIRLTCGGVHSMTPVGSSQSCSSTCLCFFENQQNRVYRYHGNPGGVLPSVGGLCCCCHCTAEIVFHVLQVVLQMPWRPAVTKKCRRQPCRF